MYERAECYPYAGFFLIAIAEANFQHLSFKQAQTKMCHSPKVQGRVEIFFTSLTNILGQFFFKIFKVLYILNR